MSSTFRRLGLLLFVALSFVPSVRAQPTIYRPALSEKYIEASLRTDWYGVYFKNQKIGYVRNDRKRVAGEIVEEQAMAMKLVSFGKRVEMGSVQTTTFAAAAPHRMVRTVLIEKSGPITKTTTVARTEDGYEVIHDAAGEKRLSQLKELDFTLADASAVEVWVRHQPKIDAVVVTRSFDPGELKMDTQTNTILSSKSSLAGGVKVHFYEVETASKLRQIKSLNRYDDQGNTLSATVLIFELRKETEEQAKNTQYSQDLFVLGMVKVDRPIGKTPKIAELVLEVSGKEAAVFEDGPRQSIGVSEKGIRVIKLGKKYGKAVTVTPEEIAEARAETNAYPISHPKIKALAQAVTAGAMNDQEKVAKLVAFVHDAIKPSLAANAPNIHDLLQKKQGDCKSYALLFNNLARAAGVPAREVSGLLYVGDDFKAFGGHAWNEVVLGGVWVPVDASMGETEVNATHICFGTEHRATKNLLTTLGKLSFRLVEVK